MDLAPLFTLYERLPEVVLVMGRVGALFFSAPFLGGPFIPGTVKALLTLAITLTLVPILPPIPITGSAALIVMLARELLIGTAFGWLLGVYVAGIRMGGEFINRHAGFSAAENFDPEADIGAGPIGDLFQLAAVLLIFALDLHLWFITALAHSFSAIPAGVWHLGDGWNALVVRAVEDHWKIATVLSFPVLTAIMLITVAEGVLTRAIPQINLMSLSFAIKIVVSVGVVAAGLPATVAFIGSVLILMQGTAEALLRGFM